MQEIVAAFFASWKCKYIVNAKKNTNLKITTKLIK